jgi:membrane fusion protein (multidrug efflux system)
MSEKSLKIVPSPEAKTQPGGEAAAREKTPARRFDRKRLRTILLIVLPLIAVIGGGAVYLTGGRYISTDNAYVGAQKVLITPDISGKITYIAVHEGQHVKPGDELFTLDPVPYRLALASAQGKLDAAKVAYDKLTTTLGSLTTLVDLAQKNVALKQRDLDRKMKLVESHAGSQADVDTSASAMVTAKLQAQFAKQQLQTTLSQLLGNPKLPLAEFPEYAQAKAALDDAKRNLDHTVVRAPISGTATQVDSIQLGRFIPAGTPVFSVIDDQNSFPDHSFAGTVVAVSPGTGAQFSILPAQNATGNWVKVVQRVPVRIAFDKDEDTRLLRAGMSVNVAIDTHHSRMPFFSAQAKEPTK